MSNQAKNKILIIFACIVMAASCSINGHQGNGDDNFFSSFTTFANEEWPYAEPFEVTVDTLADSICRRGDLLLTLRHSDAYRFSNIWLEVAYDLDDTTETADTVNIILSDVYGHWRGRGMGSSFQVNDTIRKAMPLRRHQRLRVRHIMRTDTLEDIEQIGISYLPYK